MLLCTAWALEVGAGGMLAQRLYGVLLDGAPLGMQFSLQASQ